ncbi:MAG: uracil-DNA glycosylase, partial [Oscillospiraceae bacterium]
FWYPLFAACSFIRKTDSEVNKFQEYPEYIIPQLFLTRLNEKSASTGIVYGIRYFSCADEKSYLKGFNYVFPCGETIENINKPKFHFSEKLVDSFKLTLPEKYKVSFSESGLQHAFKSDNDISSEDWERFMKDGNLDEDAFIKELEVHESWNEFIHNNKEIIRRVIDQIKMNEILTPKNPRKVFRFLTRDLTKVKVVILGQDPYPQKNVATGRAFEINEINKWEDILNNSSLLNILKSLYRNSNNKVLTKKQLEDELCGGDFQILPPTSWFDSMENQGILFLNSYFTCDIGKRSPQKKNHKKIWMEFSCKLLNEVSNRNPKIKWFVWGSEAKKLVTKCKVKGSIFYSYHPSVFFGKEASILYFDWTGNDDKIKWLGINGLEKVEETLEKSQYYSIENTKLVADE